MRLSILAFTRRGCLLARRVKEALSAGETRMMTMEKFGFPDFESYHPPLSQAVGDLFSRCDQLVFIGSTGMAVRGIAPWVKDKKTDPGVLVIDEGGTYVISLLSGHIGGANALTRDLARAIGAQPIVTTATDVEGKFSVDTWATQQGFSIGSMALAKAVSGEILERDVPFCAEKPPKGTLPQGLTEGKAGDLGIYVGVHGNSPYGRTLHLIPKALTLGLGCRRGTPKEAIARAVDTVLAENGLRPEAVASAASIDLKKDEQGLLDFCAERKIPIRFYSAEELRAVPGKFTPSSFVSSVTGVDNVCERAAAKSGGTMIVKKTACQGVTVAVAETDWEVSF